MSYRIASFNVHNLSNDVERDIERIANIINDNHLDIVAMQEVLSNGKRITGTMSRYPELNRKFYARSLLGHLRGNWQASWAKPDISAKNYPYYNNDQREEGYAFLWNTDKFELLRDEGGRQIWPRILTGYKINNSMRTGKEQRVRLMRDPYYGRFKVKGLKAELRLITTHILFDNPEIKTDTYMNLNIGSTALRKNEFYTLANDIYRKVNTHKIDINYTASYTIILGDYNLNLKSSYDNEDKFLVPSSKPSIPDIIYFDSKGNVIDKQSTDVDHIIHTTQNQLTTLKIDSPGYANNYDHFSYEGRVKDHIIKSVYCVDAVHQHVQDGNNTEDDMFKTYREKVSDHIPIVLEIDFK